MRSRGVSLATLLFSIALLNVPACFFGDSSGPSDRVRSVVVVPAMATLAPGGSLRLSVTARDEDGNVVMPVTFRWSSSNPEVATVSDSGLVTAIAEGTAVVRATAERVSGESTITVEAG